MPTDRPRKHLETMTLEDLGRSLQPPLVQRPTASVQPRGLGAGAPAGGGGGASQGWGGCGPVCRQVWMPGSLGWGVWEPRVGWLRRERPVRPHGGGVQPGSRGVAEEGVSVAAQQEVGSLRGSPTRVLPPRPSDLRPPTGQAGLPAPQQGGWLDGPGWAWVMREGHRAAASRTPLAGMELQPGLRPEWESSRDLLLHRSPLGLQ